MSGDGGSGNCTVGATLTTMVKKLFRWTSADDSATDSQSCLHRSVLPSSMSADLIGSDLNGNVPRGDSTTSGNDGSSSVGIKLAFREPSFQRTVSVGRTVCRYCGAKVESPECQAFTVGMQPTVKVCAKCCQELSLDYGSHIVSRLRSSSSDIRRQSGRLSTAADGGEPVCCCDSCSAVAVRLRRSPDFASSYWMCSSTELHLSASLPTSMRKSPTSFDVSMAPTQRPRLATMQPVETDTERGRLMADASRRDHGGQSGNPSTRIVADLPPSIPASPDGEEGYPAYRRRLVALNQAVRDSDPLIIRAPPNVTIRHLTDDDEELLM